MAGEDICFLVLRNDYSAVVTHDFIGTVVTWRPTRAAYNLSYFRRLWRDFQVGQEVMPVRVSVM